MKIFGKLTLSVAAALTAAAWSASPTRAQNYPSQRITIVVPFGAGSVTDILARIVADEALKTPQMKEKLAKQFVIPVSDTPAAFDKIIADETAKLTEIFKDAGI
ncbi:MAG TPA: hypothetical protein VMH84_00230 [Xanthobacteraceae bacterium]|nr:hypothetical protein [Xanthobacteraceae bacterium]